MSYYYYLWILGRLNSVQGLMSTFMSFIVVSLYSTTYNLTFEYLPGAVFLLNIILTFPVLIIFMWVNMLYKC